MMMMMMMLMMMMMMMMTVLRLMHAVAGSQAIGQQNGRNFCSGASRSCQTQLQPQPVGPCATRQSTTNTGSDSGLCVTVEWHITAESAAGHLTEHELQDRLYEYRSGACTKAAVLRKALSLERLSVSAAFRAMPRGRRGGRAYP
jgi:hypothetical protein